MAHRLTALLVSRRGAALVVLLWLLVAAGLGPLSGRLTGAEKNDAKAWLPGSAESTRALELEAAFQSPNTMPAILVYERRSGLTAEDRRSVTATAAALRTQPAVDRAQGVAAPIFSTDGRSASVLVPLDLGHDGWAKAATVVADIRTRSAGPPGLTLHVTGPAGFASDSAAAFEGIDGTLLYSALAVVVVILLLTYRSPVLWLLPVASAGVALTSSQGVIYLLARHAGLTVNAQSAGILTVLVFGAGTDYALLLVARYREELRRHEDRHEAMALALHRAAPAVVASASTVVLGLLCLLAAEANSTRGLGPVAAVGVVVALLAMTTLLPALLVLSGRRVFWPVRPRFGTEDPTASGAWARIGTGIARRPRTVWAATSVVLALLALGLLDLQATGLTNAESFRGHPDSVVGEQVLGRHFPAGAGTPVDVVGRAAAADPLRAAFAGVRGIVFVAPARTAQGLVLLQGTLAAPPDSPAAAATVRRVRTAVHGVPGAEAVVGGSTALNLDVQEAARHDRDLIIPVVLVVVLLILTLLLRALVAPLLLIATVVLSFGAALGVSALLFNHVFGFGGADTAFPLFSFVFLVALGIDYNIFLMTRVREETVRSGTHAAALTALAATGGVITSAGLVLAGTFAVLATLPLIGFAEIGFTVALGVLLDTLVVRSVLVTALTLDVGRWMWWPHRLARLPDPAEVAEPQLTR